VATAIAGEREAGRDAVHDAFVQAVRQLRRFRRDGSLEAWVWRIVVNEARKRRASSSRVLPTDPGDLSIQRAETNGDDPANRARALVTALPERQRLALFLRYYADLDYRAIGESLGVKPGTVASTLNAAHAALRKQLEKEVPR